VIVEMPSTSRESRLVPDERCAVIRGTVVAGRTKRRLPRVEVRGACTHRSTDSDSLGNYRIALPGRHHALRAYEGGRFGGVDTVVVPGESAVVDLRLQPILRSPVLHAFIEWTPMPWRAPLRDATTADSDIVRAVEDWLEQRDLETEDTSNSRTFAAFELLGTSSRGSWVTAFGRVRYSIPESPYRTPDVTGAFPCIACLRKVAGRWVAAGPWYDEERVSPFAQREDWFPARYRKRIWSRDESQVDKLEARVKAKVTAWERRNAELQKAKP
jgi:hypothetical protein